MHVNHTGAQLTSGLIAKPAKTDDGQAGTKDGEVPPEDAVVGGSTD
jgi:hypothetical protein